MDLKRVIETVGGLALCALAVPAYADVKAGVDAWSAGDYAAAVGEWTGPAGAGDPDAQFNLAQAYRLGRGVAADVERAEELYRMAAQRGHVRAADNYGLLLFQSGRREEALPYVEAAALRGDPRAQYLLGVAHFNGDWVAKDWVRAYALATLANGAGLPEARSALAQMDDHVPLAQRQEAQVLARTLKSQAVTTRANELAALDFALQGTTTPAASPVAPVPADAAKPTSVATENGGAGKSTPPAASPRMDGPWKVQLGAFGVPGNSDRLWAKLKDRAALSGAVKLERPAGRLTLLLASGFESEGAARKACSALKAQGQECLVTR